MVDRLDILYPFFTMIIISFFVIYRQFFINRRAIKKKDVRFSYFKLFASESSPAYLESAREHYKNIFQVPILFYILCMFIYFSDSVDKTDLILAWIFIAGRFSHFLVRIWIYDWVNLRASCFAIAIFSLTIHWIKLIISYL